MFVLFADHQYCTRDRHGEDASISLIQIPVRAAQNSDTVETDDDDERDIYCSLGVSDDGGGGLALRWQRHRIQQWVGNELDWQKWWKLKTNLLPTLWHTIKY